jgi:leader peptidase (prepilin peptidase)/N-methyltransferase
MLISRYATLLLIPFGWILSAINWLPLTLYESVLGSVIGYAILYVIALTFKAITRKDGMGQGDLELLAFIGSFTGPIGCIMTLFIGSTLGAVIGIAYISLFKQNRATMIPFGPFLALGAMIYTLIQSWPFLLIFGQ